MGFLLPVSDGSCELQPPFDIAGDLDTPVSAFMKLGAFAPRFLLESVEGGERLARYSFIGFGDGLEVRLDAAGLQDRCASDCRCRPARPSCSRRCARALREAPRPQPDIPGVPLAGGLVGYAAYDVVRYFERLPARPARVGGVPALHYVAPRSVLVFDHLTRGIALLHAGTEAERRALAQGSGAGAARRAAQRPRAPARYAPPQAAYPRADYIEGVRRTQEYIAAGDVYQLVLSSRFSGRHELDPFQAYRALRLINPSPYMYYCALGRRHGGRLLARGAGEAQRPPRAAAPDCRHAAARGATPRVDAAPRGGAAGRSRRKTPSTSCWSTWRATTSAASRTPAACASSPIARSSATATSCTW